MSTLSREQREAAKRASMSPAEKERYDNGERYWSDAYAAKQRRPKPKPTFWDRLRRA